MIDAELKDNPMTSIAANKVKENISELLERTAKGESITITRRGVAIAVLQPPHCGENRKTKDAITKIKRLRSKHHLNGMKIRDMIKEGRP